MTAALLGCWAGWIAVRLLAVSGRIAFALSPPVEGLRTYSRHAGYAKEQDFFWYAAAVIAGAAGAWIAAGIARGLDRRGWLPRRERAWSPVTGFVLLGGATLLAFSQWFAASAVAALLCGVGALLPWGDRRWVHAAAGSADATTGSAGIRSTDVFPYRLFSVPTLLILILSFVVVADPCIRYRGVDGHHEGNMLLYAVHAVHGEVAGLDFRPEYGPLFIHTFTGWMRLAGMVVVNERWYFAAAQWLGAALHLLVIVLLCRSIPARIAGGWLMLSVTTAPFVQYGWANGLRTALPLLGFALAWRAADTGALAAAGAVAAAGWWYSQEFGAAAILAAALVLLLRRDLGGRGRWGWAAGAAVAGGLVLPLLLYGRRMPEMFSSPPGGGMLLAKLGGSGSVPFPPFLPWDGEPTGPRLYWWNDFLHLELWFPALLAGPAAAILAVRGARTGRGPLVAGLAILALLYQWPAVVRPLDQIRMCAAGAIVLGAVMLDPLAVTRRWVARGAAAAAVGYGAVHLFGLRDSLVDRVVCLRAPAPYPAVRLGRLGEIWLPPREEIRETALVETITRWCPPDGRVYSGAAYDTQVLFLADRMGLSPYPVPFVTQDRMRRAEAAASLARWKPAVALIDRHGVDLPWEQDRREEWEWLRPRYRKVATFDRVEVWVPKSPG